MAFLIDGKKISSQIKDELKNEVAEMKKEGTEVTLAVIQVGDVLLPPLVKVRQQEKGLCLYRYPLTGIRIA